MLEQIESLDGALRYVMIVFLQQQRQVLIYQNDIS
jgi:hypothetical protein